jgi:hypothetical protein
MRRTEIRGFVERFLALRSLQARELGAGLLAIDAPPADREGRPVWPHVLAFGSRVHRAHPEAELVAVGSAFLDRVVGEAVAAGGYVVRYRAAPSEGRARRPDPAKLPPPAAGVWSEPQRAYRPVFLFVYVAEYRTIDVPDDVELIPLDPLHGQGVASPGALLEALRAGLAAVPPGWRAQASHPTPAALRASLTVLDRRLQRRARRVKEAAALEIARETANIEAYYRQLIDEVRHPVGRGRLTPAEEEERVRALQLDWKRRVQEVASFWEAGASVKLSALGVLMEPCWACELRPEGTRSRRRGRALPFAAAEYASGAFLPVHCALCGQAPRSGVTAIGADLVCAAHLDEGAGKIPAAEETA